MVKLVDTLGLGSNSFKRVGVQLPSLVKMDYAITSMLAVIKTGLMNRESSIIVPYKSLNRGFLNLLYKEGFINGFIPFKEEKKKIEIVLKYHHGKPTISDIVVFSTLSRKLYISCATLWKLDTSTQTFVLSTTKGMLTGVQAKKNNIGGELICLIR